MALMSSTSGEPGKPECWTRGLARYSVSSADIGLALKGVRENHYHMDDPDRGTTGTDAELAGAGNRTSFARISCAGIIRIRFQGFLSAPFGASRLLTGTPSSE
jgi:hypothetical protein